MHSFRFFVRFSVVQGYFFVSSQDTILLSKLDKFSKSVLPIDATGWVFSRLRPEPVDQDKSLATSLILYESYLTLKHYTYDLRRVSL